MRWLAPLTAIAVVLVLALSTAASAHLERPSYWPDPAPDTAVEPAAGGEVPTARGLYTALQESPPGTTRVVCQGAVPNAKRVRTARRRLRTARRRDASTANIRKAKRKLRKARRAYRNGVRSNASILRLRKSIATARQNGYRLRPSQPEIELSQGEARRLSRFNDRLLAQCRFDSIQEAVNASHNNDRVVVMPGLYTEPASRRAPVNDPRCNPSLLQNDQTGTPTPSYEYQVTCPNDQNLIYVQGRAVKGEPMTPPRANRHGIPTQEVGDCIRCNLQTRGLGPDSRGRDHGRRRGLHEPARPAGEAERVRKARGPADRSL